MDRKPRRRLGETLEAKVANRLNHNGPRTGLHRPQLCAPVVDRCHCGLTESPTLNGVRTVSRKMRPNAAAERALRRALEPLPGRSVRNVRQRDSQTAAVVAGNRKPCIHGAIRNRPGRNPVHTGSECHKAP